ncbi:MAG: transcription termination/antitermination protein NusA [Leptospiraceae bacterium]|nr:MAG: transcription termination/antitermination protein NusA [Leptospiraceae bacterium]
MATKETELKKQSKKDKGPDIKAFYEDLRNLATTKNLTFEQILEVFKSTLISVLNKKYGPNSNIDIKIEPENNILDILVHFNVVEKVQSPDYEISLEEAKKIDPNAKIGSIVTIYESLENFSRVGAFDIKNIFKQRLKDLENELLYNEFLEKKGEIVTAQIQFSKGNKDILVSLGKIGAILPKNEQLAKEKYPPGKHIKAVIKDVILKKDPRRKDTDILIIISRSSPLFVKALFKEEVSEIQEGIVEIINIVREPGFRTKMLVKSNRIDVDPVGACVGIRGSRIQSILREIHNEKIDIVGYSDNPASMITQALNPAKITEVHVDPEAKEALVIVPDYEINKALGSGGKNVRLASQLLNYKINIKTEREFKEEMSSPETKAKLEALFHVGSNEEVEETDVEEETPISELPGLTKRVIELLESGGIKSVEQLVEILYPDDRSEPNIEALQKIPGINKNMAEYIAKIVNESVEIEDEEE